MVREPVLNRATGSPERASKSITQHQWQPLEISSPLEMFQFTNYGDVVTSNEHLFPNAFLCFFCSPNKFKETQATHIGAKSKKNRNEKVVWRSVARCDRTVRKFITIHISRLCSRHQHLYLDICPRINFVTVPYRNVLCVCVCDHCRVKIICSLDYAENILTSITHTERHIHTHIKRVIFSTRHSQ